MTKRKHKYPIVSLILYIIGIIILMVEAAIPGDKSAQQSNAVGNTLADFFNDVEGDQTVAIPPESLTISNKIDTGFVGEEHRLTYEVLPKDSTYKSTVFSSSDKNVASINEDGVISFLNIGTVTISATNEHYPSINDSFTLTVYNVEATSISSSILNATIDEDVYTLYLGYFGLLPKFLLELSPFHGSLFFTSMGSLGIKPIYHHLYDFGNLPVFGAFGCKRRALEIQEDGSVVQKKYIDIKFVLDERIVDGYYYATFFKHYRSILRHPELLDVPPTEIVNDID